MPDPTEPKRKERAPEDANRLLLPRLKHILELPGISDKERKLLETNLNRLTAALRPQKS